MHVFAFSPRKGTAAASFQDTVDKRVIKERSQILRSLDTELGHKFRQQFVGKTDTILLETSPHYSNGQAQGRSERYFMVYLEKPGINHKKNELVKVKLVENREDGMTGEAVVEGNFEF